MWNVRNGCAASAVLILLTAAGCRGSTGPAANEFCLIAAPIHGDPAHDTAETMRQIDEHNAVGVELCGW